MENLDFDFSLLSKEQASALNDEQKAVFQLLHPDDREFFADSFSPKDLPGALDRKTKILKRNANKRAQLEALSERFEVIRSDMATVDGGESGVASDLNLGDIASGAAAALGIGVVAKTISTDGTASWQGVPPRVIARALERNFDDGETTDIEVEGMEDNLFATIYLRPPKGGYVPGVTVSLIKTLDNLEVKVSNLTKESFLEAAKHSGKQLLQLAEKGLMFWRRRQSGSPSDMVGAAGAAFDTVFDAKKTVDDLKLEDRVWEIIREIADPREKAYKIEAAREKQAYQDLIDSWDDYYGCPRCGEPFRADDQECQGCGRARNQPPTQSDPRKEIDG